ncbi:MAG: molybdopterin-dependent oxidoreductase [Deltaproteobacteria bacterium]
MRTTQAYTFCDGCNHIPKCGIVYELQDGVITHLRSRTDFGYPNNTLCAKGYAQLQEHYHPDRLLHPMRRSNSKGSPSQWERISWDEAIDLIAERLLSVKEEYGADKVCFYTGDPKEMRPPLQRLAYAFGSPNFGTESSTCFTSIWMAGKLLFGAAVMGGPPGPETKTCFVWGTNPAYSRPTMMKGLLAAKERGVRYVVVDPRISPTVQTLAAVHLPIRPGTDGALALGMMSMLIEDGLYDRGFVEQWTHGFGELKAYLEAFSVEKASEITGLDPEEIRIAAREFSGGPATLLISAAPIVHHLNGCQNARAVLSLFAITGNIGRKGGVRFPPRPVLAPDHVGDPAFCRRTDLLPRISHLRADAEAFPVWAELVPEIQMNHLPEYVAAGKIRAMAIFGGNAKMWPQPHEYQEALRKLDFAFAVDYFERPWTHDFVDVLLPAATCFERRASFAVFDHAVYLRQPSPPRGEAREDWQIIADLGVALGLGDDFFGGSLRSLLNAYLAPTGRTYDEIRAAPGSMVEIATHGPDREEGAQLGFNTFTGKIELASTLLARHGLDALPVFREPADFIDQTGDKDDRDTLVLMTGNRVPFFTHSKWR